MKDGTTETLIGPWSSNSESVHAAGFPPCLEVSITEHPEVLERGRTFYSGAITLELAEKTIAEFLPGVCLITDEMGFIIPALVDGRCKPSGKKRWK